MQAPVNLGIPDAAAVFVRLVRYKLSSRNENIPLPRDLLQPRHYEEGMNLGPFDGDTTEKMEGCIKTFKHHEKHGGPVTEDIISLVCGTLGSFAANLGSVAVSEKEGGQSGGGMKAGTCADLPPDDREKVRRHAQEAVAQRESQQQNVDRDVSFVTHAGVEGTKVPVHQPYTSVPTQFKATQLVVAIAVWATQRSDPDFSLSILLLNNESEQYYITIG
jgi:hypothetical protein